MHKVGIRVDLKRSSLTISCINNLDLINLLIQQGRHDKYMHVHLKEIKIVNNVRIYTINALKL